MSRVRWLAKRLPHPTACVVCQRVDPVTYAYYWGVATKIRLLCRQCLADFLVLATGEFTVTKVLDGPVLPSLLLQNNHGKLRVSYGE